MPRPTDAKKPLADAIQRQVNFNNLVKITAELMRIQKSVREIGETKPSAPTKPAS